MVDDLYSVVSGEENLIIDVERNPTSSLNEVPQGL
jgi:hypothetical protein